MQNQALEKSLIFCNTMVMSESNIIACLKPIIDLLGSGDYEAAERKLRLSNLIGSDQHLNSREDMRQLIWALSEFLIYGNHTTFMTDKEIVALFDSLAKQIEPK